MAFAMWCQGSVRLANGDVSGAIGALHCAAELWADCGNRWGLAEAYRCLAMAELQQSQVEEALRLCRLAIRALRDETEIWWLCRSLETFASVLACRGDAGAAAALLGAAESLREAIRAPVLGYEREAYAATVGDLRSALGPTAFGAAWSEGRALEPDAALRLALGEDEFHPTASQPARVLAFPARR
jgi:non-specific serine/threonine protein kinase